jgi:long-chain acyl-CoA synthetase
MAVDVAQSIRETIAGRTDERALAFAGEWRSWDWVRSWCANVDAVAATAGHVALVARNRPQHVAAMAANLAMRRSMTMIHAAQSAEALARNIRTLTCTAIFADPQDWSKQALAAANEIGARAIAIEDRANGATILQHGSLCDQPEVSPDFAFSLLSSGTTGAPKNIPVSWETLNAAAGDAATTYAGSATAEAPILMLHPLGNVAGLSYVVPALVRGQPIVLLEKFEPHEWARAVRLYRPVRSALPPAALRMVMDAGIARSDLGSLTLIAVGGARLEPAMQDAFEDRYGIPVLTAYGATEFGGVIATWPLEEYKRIGKSKRGSCGKVVANVEIRVVDPATGDPLPHGEQGLLEAKVGRIGPDWIRTNDLVSLDCDGFLFAHGRADGAINRGGFKVVPEVVTRALAGHPAVADAAVVGIADDRLGEVPVAAVELAAGQSASGEMLRDWLRGELLAYQIPTRIITVSALPRNPSMKVALAEVRALFA